MANSDYSQGGSGLIAQVATLTNGVNQGETVLPYQRLTGDSTELPALGSGVMIDDEIMKLTARDATTITVDRGCADTIPAVHIANSAIWFFDNRIGSDNREYISTETIGVKVLMRTSGAQMAVESSPPNQVIFRQRFIKPYPPAQVKINGSAWHSVARVMTDALPNLVLTWVHRDRVTQDDQLIGHLAGSIGPETGTTYTARVRRLDGTLKRTVTALVNTWTYTRSMALADFGPVEAGTPYQGYIELCSVRGGFESFQQYRLDFTLMATTVPGWGNNWGNAWGG